jgi:hypothetical protein
MDIQKKNKTFLLKIILKLPLIANLHKKFNLKLVTRNEICFQNYIKFTKNPKQTKILILNNFTIRQNYYFKKKSPEMRFVFKIISNLQKIQNKQKY